MENIFCVPAQAIPNRPCVNHGVRIAAPPPLLALPGRTPARLATRCHLATALARQATVTAKRGHPLRRPAWRPSSTWPLLLHTRHFRRADRSSTAAARPARPHACSPGQRKNPRSHWRKRVLWVNCELYLQVLDAKGQFQIRVICRLVRNQNWYFMALKLLPFCRKFSSLSTLNNSQIGIRCSVE